MSTLTILRDGVNRALRPLGVQVVRGFTTDPGISPFLPARRTVAKAKRAGMSVGDYLDAYSAEPGATAATVDAMIELGGLDQRVSRVCEIGAGSGRYARKVLAALEPDVYEVYETAPDWRRFLRELPNVTVRPADGHTLRPTASASVDLVHAHKLFVYIPFIVTVGYLKEMARVVRSGGVVAFDVITQDCVDEVVIKGWLSEPGSATIYSVTPREWAIDLLARHGLALLGSRFVPLSGGRTELLVFRRL
ncbi:phospholipid N-methyltransferase [Saccharomonospora marina XMU15]|uniref:Phospholipid N-methyltransferase n=1 Tax=Saccharomonospora marina XMU15 TaxID=882083 RepID=H5WXN9_9PSEU|nr:class I SAM-dependent methyltransferase [Saccharomonospora marina]EHR50642.1 phospholipid N-methyltransferase [Saccharomonospora marina XMU15]